MAFVTKDGLKYYVFDIFDRNKLVHGIFTRHGGVSQSYYHSLNLGGNNGDPRENVIENRSRLFNVIGKEVESLFDVWQVHSSEIVSTNSPRPLDAEHLKADSILTNVPGITLFMRFGDCVPILLHDPVKNVISLIHAGWPGTVLKIVKHTVEKMRLNYGCNPANIVAGIGPSIGPDHYEIRQDVSAKFEESFGVDSDFILEKREKKIYLNLWKANSLLLEQSGVKNIQISGICTACNVGDWFSHRAEKGKTGRFGAVISLR